MAITKIRGSKQIAWDGAIDFGSNLLSTTAIPTQAEHLVNKLYVDNLSLGLDAKQSVKCMNTLGSSWSTEPTYSNGTNGVGATLTFPNEGFASYFDGTVVHGDRVLINYTDGSVGRIYNGIYTVDLNRSSPVLTRALDFNAASNASSSAYVFVETGSTYADSGWTLITDGTITFGTTVFLFVQFSGAGQITAGAGLTKTGNTLNIGAGTGITVNADSIQISASYAGQTSITTLGTITTGTWQGTQITDTYLAGISGSKVSGNITGNAANVTGIVAVANGGTGSANASGARTNLGLAIGTNVQAYSAKLDAIASLAVTDGNIIVGNGTTFVAEAGATARASLGLTIGTDVQAFDADLSSIAGLSATSGQLFKTAANTWALKTRYYNVVGSVNESDVSFATANGTKADVQIWLNGMLMVPGAGNDYTITINTGPSLAVTFNASLNVEGDSTNSVVASFTV